MEKGRGGTVKSDLSKGWEEVNKLHDLFRENFAYSQELAQTGSWTWDVQAKKAYFTPQVGRILEVGPSELGADLQTYYSFVHPQDAARVLSVSQGGLSGRAYDLKYRVITKKGGEKYVRERVRVIGDQQGRPQKIVGVLQDISDYRLSRVTRPPTALQKQSGEAKAYLSARDPLTGLPNRLYFLHRLGSLIKRVEKEGGDFALLMLDLSHLINIRDTLGYTIGEQYINQVAQKLLAYCGSEKCLYRFASLRFCLLVPGKKTFGEYEGIIQEILALFQEPEKVGPYDLNVELSVGVSIYKRQETNSEQLIRQAENALYQAKAGGKRYSFYSSDLDVLSYKRFILRNDLNLAVKRGQLRLYYQPIVDLRTYHILAIEAQVRWEHPQWGLLSPAEFLSLAEETGCIVEMGHWVLEEACGAYQKWLGKGSSPIKFSLNFSGIQFLERGFLEKTQATIAKYGLNPGFLIMQIEESALIRQTEQLKRKIPQLQALGIQVALADFGAGCSSLPYLSSFNLDFLKLDSFFTKNLAEGNPAQIILKHVIELSRQLGLKLVGGHIETPEQLAALYGFSCTAGQGPLFGKAVAAEDLGALLAAGVAQPQLIGKAPFGRERRQSFRIEFARFLEAELTVAEMNGKTIKIGSTKVLVKNIGPGGLSFISQIRLPITGEMLLKFTSWLMEGEITVQGFAVWVNELEGNLFAYGVQFSMGETMKTALVKVLNQIQSEMRRETLFTNGSFVFQSPKEYFQ